MQIVSVKKKVDSYYFYVYKFCVGYITLRNRRVHTCGPFIEFLNVLVLPKTARAKTLTGNINWRPSIYSRAFLITQNIC